MCVRRRRRPVWIVRLRWLTLLLQRFDVFDLGYGKDASHDRVIIFVIEICITDRQADGKREEKMQAPTWIGRGVAFVVKGQGEFAILTLVESQWKKIAWRTR